MSWEKIANQKKESLDRAKQAIEKERNDLANQKKDIDIPINYNWQVNNKALNKIPAVNQCGYTSACMMLSTYLAEASTDDFVAKFVVKMDSDFINNKSGDRKGAFQINYKSALDDFLRPIGKHCVIVPNGGTYEEIIRILKTGSPLVFSTMLTEHGHYILCNGFNFSSESYRIKDPYGLFDFQKKKYLKINNLAGNDVLYSRKDFEPYLEKSSYVATKKTGFRYMYIEDRK